MNGRRAAPWLLAFCLALSLYGSGNKGPLVAPDEADETDQQREERKKTRDSRTY